MSMVDLVLEKNNRWDLMKLPEMQVNYNLWENNQAEGIFDSLEWNYQNQVSGAGLFLSLMLSFFSRQFGTEQDDSKHAAVPFLWLLL